MSLPSRECGLKSVRERPRFRTGTVTPFAGVWIEMLIIHSFSGKCVVTPFAGVWIEMLIIHSFSGKCVVTPFAGVWIEISKFGTMELHLWSLPSRECGLK